MGRRQIADCRMLITGASQGIGRALALAAARRGAKVVAAARSAPLLAELAADARGLALAVVEADVSDPAGRRRMADAAVSAYGGLDVLVNNAGIGATGHFADADGDRLRQIFEVNVFGTTELVRVCLPLLRQGRSPAVVNVSSIAGKRGLPARSDYCASKFAVQGFSEAIRAEFARFGIDVITVLPGLTATNFSKNMIEQKAHMKYDHMRGMTPEQVADATLRAVEKGKREVVLTAQGKLLVLMNRFLPRLVDIPMKMIVRKLFRDEIAARRAR